MGATAARAPSAEGQMVSRLDFCLLNQKASRDTLSATLEGGLAAFETRRLKYVF
jgi:hypothetical protein